MKKLLALLLFCGWLDARAHLEYIRIEKIDVSGQYTGQIDFLLKNKSYCDHWAPSWDYTIKKDSLIRQLKTCYSLFAGLNTDKEESFLLLGEIAHYLYNLEVEEYYGKAESAYKGAIAEKPDDYRGYWFLAHHYSLSREEDQAVTLFEKVEPMLPPDVPADFWEEYGYAMMLAEMPSHCRMAVDKVKKILGKPGYLEDQLGETIRKNLVDTDPDRAYTMKDLWFVIHKKQGQAAFISRPLGVRLTIDTSWTIQFNDYSKHQSAIILKPQRATAASGKLIGYTIGVLIKSPAAGETLESYVKNISSGQGKVVQTTAPVGYKKCIAYEILNEKMYPDWGGGHMHVIAIEQKEPAYPGLALEEPFPMPEGDKGKVNYYRQSGQKSRLPGRLFYMILLDTCEAIHEESWSVFQQVVNKQLVLE